MSDTRESNGAFRGLPCVVVCGYDALATLCGLYAAMVLTEASAPSATSLGLATLLLVMLRIGGAIAARSWSFGRPLERDLGRLVVGMLASSTVFAAAFPSLPRSLLVLEFFLTTTSMVAVRLALRAFECPRRALNIVVALLGLVVTLPLWIVIAVAIKLTSRGPVFYRQERVGLDVRTTQPLVSDPRRKHDLGGRPFMMLKFRTMTVDAEKSTGAVWCAKQDCRVTLVGGFLRHTRLDELPQFINVLNGDMNVVGPRPERPTIFAELRERVPNYTLRQRARPGITGYAQVNLEYDSSIEDVVQKLQYDLRYVSRQSVPTDLWIMAKTLPVMLLRTKFLSRRASVAAQPVDSRTTR